jgi:uncharacterized protein YbaR (Trm112 family)
MTQITPLQHLYQEEIYKVKSKVLIIIPRPWEQLQEDETLLLQKILNAVKLSTASVQIVTKKEFNIQEFNSYQPSFIIAFGAVLKNSDKRYENLLIDGIPILVSDELRQLDDIKKKNLWTTLKQAFRF